MHVVRSAGLLASVLLVALLTAHAANAQGSTAKVTLTVPASTEVAHGASATLPVTVRLEISNVVCAQAPATATVNLAVVEQGGPVNGITFTMPSTVAFDMKAPMAYSANGAFTGEQTVNLNASVAAGAPANHEHKVNVTATFDGTSSSQLQGCTISPALAAMSTSDSKPASILTGASGTTTTTTSGNGTMGGTTSGTDTSKAAFSLPLAFEVALLVGMGVFASRRKFA